MSDVHLSSNEAGCWKWTALLLAGGVLILLSCQLGCLLGGVLGYAVGRSASRPTSAYLPETPSQIPAWPILPPLVVPLPDDEQSGQAWLGVAYQLSDEGALVVDVLLDSPAAAADVRRGDLIVAVDGVAVSPEQPLTALIQGYRPGDEATLTLYRDGRGIELVVTLGVRPVEMPSLQPDDFFNPGGG